MINRKVYTIRDIKDGMVLHTRERKTYVVNGEKAIRYDGYLRLKDYNVDFTCKGIVSDSLPEFDIMKITDMNPCACKLEDILNENGPVLWERNDKPLHVTYEDAVRILAEKFGKAIIIDKEVE